MDEMSQEYWNKFTNKDDWGNKGPAIAAFVRARYEKGFVSLAEKACNAAGANFESFASAAATEIKNAINEDKKRGISESSIKNSNPLINLANVEPEAVKWLWPPILPLGKLSILMSDPGVGKTYLTIDWTARVTTGEPFPGETQPRRVPGNVILQNGEDGIADTIVPRLIACKADRNRVFMISEEHKALTLSSLVVIENAFKLCKPLLFVIDPIQQYLGADKDMHRANEVRPVLAGVARLCAEYGTACIIVMHMNKGEGKAMYRALGSIDFAAIARSQLLIGKDRNNPSQNLIVHTKSSLAPAAPTMAFKILGPDGIEYLGECLATADDILKEAPSVKNDSALAEAMELIREEIADRPILSSDLEEKGLSVGISIRSIDRARKALHDCGELETIKAPGLKRWYVKRRGLSVSFIEAAPTYETPEDCQNKDAIP